MSVSIRAENLGKSYHFYQGTTKEGGSYQTVREQLTKMATAPIRRITSGRSRAEKAKDIFWALRDVSFEVSEGQVLGVVGRNGAGKSTLLKILSRITRPTTGSVAIYGRVGSLLEVGTGFHPELSGRENIFLNGSILGMTRREIAKKFDEIVAFSGIEKFLDLPVKRYSSGMFVRLAFAVAGHFDSEILLIDEVLAVGDAEFQKKCLSRLRSICDSGRTVLFVSHNLAAMLNLCDRALFIERGELRAQGETEDIVRAYLQSLPIGSGGEIDLRNHPTREVGSTPMFTKIRMLDSSGKATDQYPCGSSITLEIDVEPPDRKERMHFGIVVEDALGQRIFTVTTQLTNPEPNPLDSPGHIICHIPELALIPGRYVLTLQAKTTAASRWDTLNGLVAIDITEADYFGNGRLPPSVAGSVLVRSQWAITPKEIAAFSA